VQRDREIFLLVGPGFETHFQRVVLKRARAGIAV
jgi:hypothetical protein